MRVRDALRAERDAEKILEELCEKWRKQAPEAPKDSYVIVLGTPRRAAPPKSNVKRGRGGKRGRRRRRRKR